MFSHDVLNSANNLPGFKYASQEFSKGDRGLGIGVRGKIGENEI